MHLKLGNAQMANNGWTKTAIKWQLEEGSLQLGL